MKDICMICGIPITDSWDLINLDVLATCIVSHPRCRFPKYCHSESSESELSLMAACSMSIPCSISLLAFLTGLTVSHAFECGTICRFNYMVCSRNVIQMHLGCCPSMLQARIINLQVHLSNTFIQFMCITMISGQVHGKPQDF